MCKYTLYKSQSLACSSLVALSSSQSMVEVKEYQTTCWLGFRHRDTQTR